jgi:drug/metabolite transporter (DMT)-like permease
VILGLSAALLTAVCYGFGSILQSAVATATPPTNRINVFGLARLVAQWRYLAGLSLDLLGFGASVIALRSLPLFVVQAAIASSVGVTAVAAAVFLDTPLARRERSALGVLLVGLALLAVAGQPDHGTRLGEPGPLILLCVAAGIVAAAFLLVRSSLERSAVALAVGAGASFGAVGIAARGFVVAPHLVRNLADPLLYAIVAHGVIATLLFAAALQRGKVTTVAVVTFAVETIVPATVGLAFLGDHARPGLAPAAAAGFALTLAASIALARFGAPLVPASSL